MVALLVAVVALASPAAARQDGAESIAGKVFNEKLVEDRTTRDPVPGDYVLPVEPDTLPDGLALFLRYLIQYLFGPKTQSYGQFQNQTDPIGLGLAALVVLRPQGIFGDRREQAFDVR